MTTQAWRCTAAVELHEHHAWVAPAVDACHPEQHKHDMRTLAGRHTSGAGETGLTAWQKSWCTPSLPLLCFAGSVLPKELRPIQRKSTKCYPLKNEDEKHVIKSSG